MPSSNDDRESDGDVSINNVTDNVNLFHKMIKLCRKNSHCPHKLVEDMSKMYECCSDKQKNSRKLCNFIHNGIKNISVENKNSFDYAADVFNELLQISKKDSSNSQNENCIASTSNGIKSISEFKNEDNETREIFKRLIEKCYENPNFPNSNIEKIDKLYNSLPSEFVSSKYFSRLLKEADLAIWPDTNSSSYIHIEHIYEQLLMFQSSMTCQDKMSIENKEINQKKLKKLAVLKKALHFARKKIKALDESEMDVNNDDDFGSDSLYILKDKYEKRVIQIYKRMCKLGDEPDYLKQPPLRFNETNNILVNKAVEKFYNINKQFPDYFEIYSLLKLLNEKKKLNWTKSELQNISHTAFLKLGKRLKANRLNEYFGDLATMTTEEDPAEKNEALRNKLEESNQKLIADLTKVRDEFINKQDYAGETSSSLNNSECEISSEDEYIERNFNKNSKCIKPISIKRKRKLSYTSEDEKFPKKSKKTLYMESFNLTPIKKRGNSSIDKTDKNIVDVNNDNTDILDTTIIVKDVEAPNNTSTTVSENINFRKKNKDNNISVEEGSTESICDTEGDGALVIDEDHDNDELVSKNSRENEVQSAKIKDNSMQIRTVTDDNKSSDPIVLEPIVVINDDSVIDLNDLDDSDVEITSCDTSRVPVQNKKSLEDIIKSMNFDKKYKFGQNQQSIRHPSIHFPSRGGHIDSNINRSSTNFVNHWVMNNPTPSRPSRPTYNKHENYGRTHSIIRPHSTSHNMQSSIQKKILTARHFKQCYSNSNQQRHVPNNQSLLQQCVTTMTTTTTVRQVVRQSSKNIQRANQPIITQSNSHSQPELIELD